MVDLSKAATRNDIVEEISSLLERPLQEELFTTHKHSLEDDEEFAIGEIAPKDSITDTSLSNRQTIIQALGPTPIEVDELSTDGRGGAKSSDDRDGHRRAGGTP